MLSVGGAFDGVGLLAFGLHLAGLQHRWLCEIDEWRRSILNLRWPGIPVHADIRDAGTAWGRVDVVAGGFPCKGASTAGKRTGFGHPETVLWREMARAVRDLRPRYVLVENVANILALHDGAVWGEVLGDLAALGYDIEWDCLPAAAVGAPHLRDRVFAIAAHAAGAPDGTLAGAPRRSARGDGPAAGRSSGRAVALADTRREGKRSDGSGQLGTRQRTDAGAGGQAPPDSGSDGVRQQPESEPPRRGGEAIAGRAGEAAANAEGERGEGARPGRAALVGAAPDRGVPVEWGAFEPARRRWEAVHGPAPEPLVRRMDDRSAARVERSRLSALGDGVQVQVGFLAGERIMSLERERRAV